MKIDRVADIPIRHRLADYVCSIGYSDSREEFSLVSVGYADPRNTKKPTNGMNLYLRILKEPAARARLLETLTPDSTGQILELREKAIFERGKNMGFAFGFAALCATGYGLYELTLLLAKYVGYEWAEILTYLPAFFAFIVVFPVQYFVQSWYARRHCNKHNHRLETFKNNAGSEVTRCKRCDLRFEPLQSTAAEISKDI